MGVPDMTVAMVAESDESTRHSHADPVAAFGIGNVVLTGPRTVSAEQQLSNQVADHRGRIDLPALAVLLDHIGGLPFYSFGPSGLPCVQARLAMSMEGHIDIADRLTGTAELLMHDHGFGSTRIDIATAAGHICCAGTARNVAVGRAAATNPSTDARGVGAPGIETAQVPLPPAIAAGIGGRQIVEQIADGVRAAGPLAELLNARIELVDHALGAGVRLTAGTEPWMGNVFGTMHGGVIAAIAAQACSFAGQANAIADRDYQVGDLAISFLRSPGVHGEDVIVDVEPVKIGRRIASFEATMRAHDGTPLSRCAADIQYR